MEMFEQCKKEKKETEETKSDEVEEGCYCCYNLTKIKLCTYKCWQFLVATIFSMLAFFVAFWGLLGGFSMQDNTFYSNLITFVLGVWLPSPSMKPEKKKGKDASRYPVGNNEQRSFREEKI